ncbi:MAG: hypothetical protein ACLFSE_16055, partial [Spirochaetia bacterium]
MRYIFSAIVGVLLLAGCGSSGEYHSKLSGGDYAYEEPPVPLSFVFEDVNTPRLTVFREQFNLQEAAGAGPERDRIIGLLKWAYTLVPWDGSAPWPKGVLCTDNIVRWQQFPVITFALKFINCFIT